MIQNENTTTAPARAPSFIAFHVTDSEGDNKGFWTRIGAAWNHQDGKGLTLQLDLIPAAGGRITLRVPSEKKDGNANQS